MKLSYRKQLIVCSVIIILFNVLTTLLKHWIWHSIGWCLCGLLWIVSPVMIHDKVPTQKEKRILQILSCVLIFIGIFSRAYYY